MTNEGRYYSSLSGEGEDVAARKTEPPPAWAADLLEAVRTLTVKVEEQADRLALVESRPPDSPSPSSLVPSPRPVAREEVVVGATFWTLPVKNGYKVPFKVKIRKGFEDPEDDGNIKYRIVKLDESDEEEGGRAIYRHPDELFISEEEAEASQRPQRAPVRTTGKHRS